MSNFEIKKLKTEQSWLKERQQIITASEMAFALANFCEDETTRLFYEDILNKVAAPGKPKSRYAFYVEKHLPAERLELYQEAIKTKAMELGNQCEEIVGEKGFEVLKEQDERYTQAKLTANGRTLYKLKVEPIGATPDYIIEFADEASEILECKTIDIKNQDKRDIKLELYKLQVQTQLLCSGLTRGHIAICCVENGEDIYEPDLIEVVADEELQRHIKQSAIACANWMKSVEDGVASIDEYYDPSSKKDVACKNMAELDLEQMCAALEDAEYKKTMYEYRYNQDFLKAVVKATARQNIEIKGYTISLKTYNPTYYSDKDIPELEQLIEKIKSGLKVVKTSGSTRMSVLKNVEEGLNG